MTEHGSRGTTDQLGDQPVPVGRQRRRELGPEILTVCSGPYLGLAAGTSPDKSPQQCGYLVRRPSTHARKVEVHRQHCRSLQSTAPLQHDIQEIDSPLRRERLHAVACHAAQVGFGQLGRHARPRSPRPPGQRDGRQPGAATNGGEGV
ncbi:hypothetical protein JS756_35915, partial [Streptomyces actuosus]